MGEAIFQESAGIKLLDLSNPNLTQPMIILKRDEGIKVIVIASRVSTARYGEVAAFVLFFFLLILYSYIVHSPTARANSDG